MRVRLGHVLGLICLVCLLTSPSPASASAPGAPDNKTPNKTAPPPPYGPKLPYTIAKTQARRLAVQNHIDNQSLVFFPVPNGGDDARFTAARPGYSLTLGQSSLTLTSHQRIAPAPTKKPEAATATGPIPESAPKEKIASVKVDFVGADAKATLAGEGESPGYANFFTGNDPSKWQAHVAGYQRVRYKNLYPGIDLIYYGEKQRRLEYDLVVSPGADPEKIRLHISGNSTGQTARIGESGDLELDGPNGVMRLDAPFLYQSIKNGKTAIAGQFVQLAPNEFGFSARSYDKSKPLIIDPKINLVYATYAGGIHDDEATDLVLDANGAAYVTGYTASQDFPVSANAVQTERQNIGTYTYDAFLLKFDASGTLVFSTFLGGSATDQSRTVALDASGNVLIAGYTQSSDFPVTSNAYQKTFGGNSDAFLAKLSNDGSQLIYSTYLGGSGGEAINRMRVMPDASIVAVGDASADGLPVSPTAVQQHTLSTADGFTARFTFDDKGNLQIPALTFMGGSNSSGETGLTSDFDVDSDGNIYVTGATQSADYPITANAFMKNFPLSGGCDNSPTPNEAVFITKYSPDLSIMLYSTVFGGKTEDQNGYPVCNQYGKTIHLDALGNIWVIGSTGMSDFPVTSNAISKSLNTNGTAGVDTFVFELSADGTKQLYGTYLGGSQFDYGGAAAWDSAGDIWIAGPTQSPDYPVTSDALQPTIGGGFDTFVTELSPDGSKIMYATFLGGSGDDDISSGNRIRLDPANNIHLAGETSSTNYPVTATAFQPLYANGDANPDTADAYYTILGTGTIGAIGPIVGGNTGDLSVTVGGAGFSAGATCSLVLGGTTIQSISSSVNPSGTSVNCVFALSGAAIGSYDVVINNADGATFTKPASFTVENGSGPNVWLNVTGRAAIRFATATTFTISYGNTGDTDALGVPIYITVPANITMTLVTKLVPAPTVPLVTANEAPTVVPVNGSNELAVLIGRIPAGGSGQLVVQLTAPAGATDFSLSAYNWAPFATTAAGLVKAFGTYQNGTYTPDTISKRHPLDLSSLSGMPYFVHPDLTLDPNAGAKCLQDLTLLALQAATSAFPPAEIYACGAQLAGFLGNAATAIINSNQPGYSSGDAGSDLSGLYISGGQTALACLQAAEGSTPAGIAVNAALALLQAALNSASLVMDCNNVGKPDNPQKKPVGPVGAIDPNYKSGPAGDGSASRFVQANPFTYSVGFENEATATAPASQVVVTDQLDPSKVDLTTFSLGAISFGTTVINPPAGLNVFNTTYQISSTLNVRIAGSLDTTSGLAKWTFTSIDPSTGQPPTDPTVGFLPPDTDGIEGQGSVLFNIAPRSGQTTGNIISNMASVVFDANAPINTPVWSNTIDVSAPTSAVTALAPKTLAGAFKVSWSGKDAGSGIATYDINVSDNGGPYTVFELNTAATSASFTGIAGHTYDFYSIATDAAGNVEPAKTTPDTSTQVVAQLTPLATTITLTSSSAEAATGSSVTLTADVAPPAGATTPPTGTVTFLNGATSLGMVTLNSTGKAVFTTTLPAGTNTITASYAGDTNFSASVSTAVSIVVGSPAITVALSPSSLTIVNGSSGATKITLTSSFGFTGATTFSCSGLPTDAACSFSPASVTPASDGSVISTLTITTASRSAMLEPPTHPEDSKLAFGFLLPLLLTPLAFVGRSRRKLGALGTRLLLVFAATALFAFASGCSGGNTPPVVATGTPAGTSSVTITATSGTMTKSTTLQLTVQ